MAISEDFRSLLPAREATFGEPYDGPIYWLWVYDPLSGHVSIEDNEDRHPSETHTHRDMSPEVTHPGRINGFAYKIVGGYRITDDNHKKVDDPFVIDRVLKALKKERPPKPLPHIMPHGSLRF